MMRTTITIDDAIFSDLMRFTEARTRTAAVNQAISEWVRRKKIEKLKSLRGKLHFTSELAELRQLEIDETETLDG